MAGPSFDPNQPFEPVSSGPTFDPSKPFEPVQATPSKSWTAALTEPVTDIPHEIYQAGSDAASGINEGLNPLAHQGEPLPGAWENFKRVGERAGLNPGIGRRASYRRSAVGNRPSGFRCNRRSLRFGKTERRYRYDGKWGLPVVACALPFQSRQHPHPAR